MGQDAEQLIFTIHLLNQAGVHKHETGRRGKGIEISVVYNKKFVIKIL